MRTLMFTLMILALSLAPSAQAGKERDYYAASMTFDFTFRDTYSPADIRAYELALKRKDFAAKIQWQPLFVVAADNGDVRTVRWMLENGARADIADATGRGALFHLAARQPTELTGNRAEIARLLLLHGADPNRFATGVSVVRALTSGNRDAQILAVVLAFGGDPDGNPQDLYPPVCGAATPLMIDTLHAAGARLEFPERSDFRNVADCLALEDMDKKERKLVLKHLETTYGLLPSGKSAAVPASASLAPGLLAPGHYLYSEQVQAASARGEEAKPVMIDYVIVATPAALTRRAIIEQLVRPEGFRLPGVQPTAVALQRCAGDCRVELDAFQSFTRRNALARQFRQQPQEAPAVALGVAGMN